MELKEKISELVKVRKEEVEKTFDNILENIIQIFSQDKSISTIFIYFDDKAGDEELMLATLNEAFGIDRKEFTLVYDIYFPDDIQRFFEKLKEYIESNTGMKCTVNCEESDDIDDIVVSMFVELNNLILED